MGVDRRDIPRWACIEFDYERGWQHTAVNYPTTYEKAMDHRHWLLDRYNGLTSSDVVVVFLPEDCENAAEYIKTRM